MKENQASPIVFGQVGKATILHELQPSDLRTLLDDLIFQCNVLADLPDFEISLNQAEILLGVSNPTLKKYMTEGLLTNVSNDHRRAKFSFYQVVTLRRENIKYKRFRSDK